jgi:hypothetical protein
MNDVVTTSYHRLELARWAGGWPAVILLALTAVFVYGAVWLYRHEGRRGASAGARMLLAALRAAVIVAFAVIWLEPVRATYWQRVHPSYTVVLVDRSASMGLIDRYRDPETRQRVTRFLKDHPGDDLTVDGVPRIALAEHLLTTDDRSFVRALQRRNEVRVFDFAERLRNDEAESARPPADARHMADGPATDVGRALRGAVEALGGATVAGVVLLSDGAVNRGEPPAAIAAYAAARDIPVYAVGIGDPAEPVNVRVLACEAPGVVFVKDPFEITARLSGYVPGAEPIRVSLHESAAEGGAERLLETKEITLPADGEEVDVKFTRSVEQPGRSRYRVEAAAVPTETLLDDNSASTTVAVRDNKLRVLLVAGAPSWHYRYVSRLLERDPTFDLSCWLQSAGVEAVRDGNTIIDHLPAEASELFAYDAVLLLDPDPSGWPVGWDRMVQQLVSEHGGGMLYAAARLFTQRLVHEPTAAGVVEILPVEVGTDSDLVLNQLGLFQQKAWPVIVPPDALDHPIMRQSLNRAENAQIWSLLGEVYWHFPVTRAKPVATVLMRHADPRMANSYGRHVLLAAQAVGMGRTAFLGFDSTWRWRRFGPRYFDRFWVQLVRYLGEGKLLAGRSRATLRADRDRYELGDVVSLSMRLLDADYRPVEQPEVEVAVTAEDGTTQQVKLVGEPDRPGWFKGRFAPGETGTYRAVFEHAPEVEEAPAAVFTVSTPDIERDRPRMNEAALRTISSGSAGGRYVPISEAMQIPELIEDRHREETVRSTPVSIWDRWWTLVLLVGLLGAEWAFRKRSNLL